MKKRKIKIRRHPRRIRKKLGTTYTIVTEHMRNIQDRAKRRERFVKERAPESKRKDLLTTEPYAKPPYTDWDKDCGLEYDVLGVDDKFSALHLIATPMNYTLPDKWNAIWGKYEGQAGHIIHETLSKDLDILDKLSPEEMELRRKSSIPLYKMVRAHKTRSPEVQARIDALKENCYMESFYTIDKLDNVKLLQLIRDVRTNKPQGYFTYSVNRSNENKDLLYLHNAALEEPFRDIGLGREMILSAAIAIHDKFPDNLIKYVDAGAITSESQKIFGDEAQRILRESEGESWKETTDFKIDYQD